MQQQEDSLGRELRFPAGMRVLVVDDDPTCLKMMDQLLRKCQYLVTTTNRAKEALRILKEGRNRYDIVISDVEMPDMDGLKLLQLIGLEMSIPVIILSAYSDTKRVMQGIKNGACDYLVKPVRIQELQNIWQHVVRRNKSVTLRKTTLTPAPAPSLSLAEDVQNNNVNAERLNGHLNGDYDNNDDDEQEDSGNENEETGNQKKPRLFWSVELHQKFVDAVESLGIEKAFPKKILDLMNVEGLTREKVASHLQKYRLYLRKLNNNGSSQTSSKISAYDDANIGPLGGGYGVFRSLAGTPASFQGINPSFSHPPLLGRLNAAAGMSIRGIASSPMLQTPLMTNSSFSPNPNQNPNPTPNATILEHQNRPSLLYPPPNSITPSEYPNQSFSNITGFDGNGLLDPNRCPPNWGSLVPPQGFQHNSFTSNISDNGIMANFPNGKNNDPLDYNCGFPSVDSFNGNIQTQDGVNGNGLNSFSYLGQSHMWQDQRPDNNNNINSYNMAGGSSSLTPVEQNNYFTQLEGASSQFGQQPNMKFGDFLVEEANVAGGGSGNGGGGSEYLEDIVEKFLNKDNGETAQMGDDFDLDSFSI